MARKLKKSNKNKIIAGVCGGIAKFLNIDVTIIRLAVVVLTFISGFGILFYIVAALVMPQDDVFESEDEDLDNMKRANVDKTHFSDEKNSSKGEHSDEEFNEYFKK